MIVLAEAASSCKDGIEAIDSRIRHTNNQFTAATATAIRIFFFIEFCYFLSDFSSDVASVTVGF